MSSLVKVYLSPFSELKYVTANTVWAEGVTLVPTRNLMGCLLSAPAYKGEEAIDEIKAGSNFTVPIGYIESSSYNILFSANPALYAVCSNLQFPTILDPKEGAEIVLYGTARKTFKPEGYWLKLHMLD